ncbi:FAD-binding domain-containing protein [Hypoxylon crocopeplum]|nr:FAD-binding domain-containing protein [Hypoxylon crocopeplum]
MVLTRNLSVASCVQFLVWLVLWAGRMDAAVVRVDLRSLLTDSARQWSANTTVSFAGSPEFADATERWTIYRPPTYSAAIRPGTEADISKIIKLTTSHNIPFLVRGAGHSYTTTIGDLQNGLDVDLSQWKSLELDTAAKTVTVGPGVTIGEIFDPLYEAGFEIQTGSCSCPSLIGVTLGGGVGRMQGYHGLLIDALVSVRMITAEGERVEASQSSNQDLFWAIRGAGANFGVVTSATYNVKPLTNHGNVLNAEFTFPANMSSAFFRAVESYNDNLPAELASISIIEYNAATNETQVVSEWAYFGPENEGRRALAPIINLGAPISNISIVPWNELTATAGGGIDRVLCQGRTIRDLYNLNLKNYSASTYESSFAQMEKFYASNPGGRESVITLEVFPNQAMAKVPLGDTAFPWRDATAYINPTFTWSEGDNATARAAQELGQKLRSKFAATSGYKSPTVFINYARGDEGLEHIYGREKLPRLAQLKKAWDPKKIFRYNNGLPTQYP